VQMRKALGGGEDLTSDQKPLMTLVKVHNQSTTFPVGCFSFSLISFYCSIIEVADTEEAGKQNKKHITYN